MSGGQPVQLRLGFGQPETPMRMHLTLMGLAVLASTEDTSVQDIIGYLSSVGVGGQPIDDAVKFGAADLPALAKLPAQVTILPDRLLAPMWTLICHPPHLGRPAELSVDGDDSMWLHWFDGEREHQLPVGTAAAAALLTMELPFTSSPAGFAKLRAACQLPPLVGRARVNLDGFVEIVTAKPQLAEAAPLPGLFRLDETHLGVPLGLAHHLNSAAGFSWAGPQPRAERPPRRGPALPFDLSDHARDDVSALVSELAVARSRLVVWDSGLGRRVMACAAAETLDAWPMLVVCPAHQLWVWTRIAGLFCRTVSVDSDGADIRLITYRGLVSAEDIDDPQSIIFDDVTSADVGDTAVHQGAAARLGGLADCYRLGLTSAIGVDPARINAAMALLRPVEFRTDVPLAARYPLPWRRRFDEHVASYTSRRVATADARAAVAGFHRSTSVLSEAPAPLLAAMADMAHQPGVAPAARLTEVLEASSAGLAHLMSPKIATAVRLATQSVDAGSRVAVVTRYQRTMGLLSGLLAGHSPARWEVSAGPVPRTRLTLLRVDTVIPDLTWFDHVIVVDYPWSLDSLDAAVGSAAATGGPSLVHMLHLHCPLEDRLALLATYRSLRPGAPAYPTPGEVDWLLSSLG